LNSFKTNPERKIGISTEIKSEIACDILSSL